MDENTGDGSVQTGIRLFGQVRRTPAEARNQYAIIRTNH